MLHACFVYIPTCFMCTFMHFLAFSRTNLLTRCRSASSCFCCFCVSENWYRKYAQNCTGQKPRTLFPRNEAEARRGVEGGPQGGQTHARRRQPWARTWPVSGPTRAPPTPPFRLFILRLGKTLDT